MNAIYAVGQDRYVFVKDLLRGVRPAKVSLGMSNDTHVQVTDGLAAGQDVLLLQVGQGRDLLEKAGIKAVETPTTKPTAVPGVKPTGVAVVSRKMGSHPQTTCFNRCASSAPWMPGRT